MGCKCGAGLTHYAARTTHSEDLLIRGRRHRKCTARSSPPAHGWPGNKTHTGTHTWVNIAEEKKSAAPSNSSQRIELMYTESTGGVRCLEHEIKGTSPLWLSEINSSGGAGYNSTRAAYDSGWRGERSGGFWNTCKHTDGLRLHPLTNSSSRTTRRSPVDQKTPPHACSPLQEILNRIQFQ